MRDEFEDTQQVEVLPAVTQGNALEQISRAEIDMQISTAKRFPRELTACKRKIAAIALDTEESAAECYYVMPRGGKSITGPSVRLAEIVANSWGNMRVASRVMDIGQKEVTVASVCHDLESNVAVSSEVKRRITSKDGRRYNDDMILMTCNAAASIAFRNSIFKVVPQTVWKPVLQAAMDRVVGKNSDVLKKREQSIKWFRTKGVTEEQILHKLNRNNVSDINAEDIAILRGFATAINEESSTVEEIFGENNNGSPGVKRSLDLNRPASMAEEPPEPGSNG